MGQIAPDTVRRAREHLHDCHLCEHACGANRLSGERGPCKAGPQARVFRHRIEYGEELELIPSHLFYLSGCDLRCTFCIAGENAFDPSRGTELTGAFLRQAVAWGQARGARNLQWVGGEPTIHLPNVLEAMAECDGLPPIVWKSDFYATSAALTLLKSVVDVFVADFKFGNDECAKHLAKVDRYVEVITRNLLTAAQHSGLIIRHLLLPGHFDCCYRPIVGWVARHLPQAKFSIRDGYLPKWQAHRDRQLAQPLDATTGPAAHTLAHQYGLNVIT